MTPIFTGRVIEGKLILDNPQGFKEYYSLFNRKEIQLTIEKKRKKRTNNQNAYYWGVCLYLISEKVGYTPDELHEALKWKFLKVSGEVIERIRSTADLTTIEFEEYLENIKRWAAELGVVIPDPNSVDYTTIQNYQ